MGCGEMWSERPIFREGSNGADTKWNCVSTIRTLSQKKNELTSRLLEVCVVAVGGEGGRLLEDGRFVLQAQDLLADLEEDLAVLLGSPDQHGLENIVMQIYRFEIRDFCNICKRVITK